MNNKNHDELLKPLIKRPDLIADSKFRVELHHKLIFMATEKKHFRNTKTWIPNILTAALLFIGVIAGYQVMKKDENKIFTRQAEQVKQNNQKAVELTDQMARETVGAAFTHILDVYNGGGEQTQEFNYKGEQYRFMPEYLNSRKKIVDYLELEYTKELANRIFGVLDCIEYTNKLAQPIKDSNTNLLWTDATIASKKQINDSTWTIQFKVAIDHKGSPIYRYYNIEFKYENGWKLNGALPLTSNIHSDELAVQGEGKHSSGYMLTENDLKIYENFSKDLNENHLKGLDPRAIAWFYVNAQGEQRYDIAYALYTDRNGYVLWTKEEDEKISTTDRLSQQQLAEKYTGLVEGTFIKTGSFNGYIEFTNSEGKQSFQMIQDEDGVWNVAFMPLQ